MLDRPDERQSLRVSVVIPAYNAASHIGRALNSVLQQSERPEEIIVVDDGSSDRTKETVEAYGPAIRYIYQANAGAAAARNRGISAARNEWIAFLDADDEWLPQRLERQKEVLKQHAELLWITGNYYHVRENEGIAGVELPVSEARILLGDKAYLDNYFEGFLRHAGGWTGTMLIKKDVLIEAGAFPEEKKVAEDIDLWWRIAYRHPAIGYVVDPLAKYYIVPTSLSQYPMSCEEYGRFIESHLEQSRSFHREESFRPVASRLIQLWIRSALFRGDKTSIQHMLNRFKLLLPFPFRLMIRTLILWPEGVRRTCLWLSRLNKRFRLRNTVIRRDHSANSMVHPNQSP